MKNIRELILTVCMHLVKKKEDKLEDIYSQAYPNMRHAEEDCREARIVLQRQYNVRDEDIIEIKNGSRQKCIETYNTFLTKLEKNKSKRMLIFHVFNGHGALKDGHQSMLINKFDPETCFYERFEAEK